MTGKEGGEQQYQIFGLILSRVFLKNMTIEKGTSKVIYFLEIPMMIDNRDSNAGVCKKLTIGVYTNFSYFSDIQFLV